MQILMLAGVMSMQNGDVVRCNPSKVVVIKGVSVALIVLYN